MATSHLCKDGWAAGPVSACSKHEKNYKRKPVKMGQQSRRKADKAAGVVGQDRGGYING